MRSLQTFLTRSPARLATACSTAALFLLACLICTIIAPAGLEALIAGGLAGLAGLAAVFGVRDALLTETRALPNGAATVYSAGIDLQGGTLADKRGIQALISAPAVNTTECPDTKTLKYTLQHDTDPAFGTAADLHTDAITQTGAGGAGAAAAEKRIGLPDNCNRYVRLKVVGSAAGNATTATATLVIMPS